MRLQALLEETDRSAVLKAQQELIELLPDSDIRIVKIDPTQGYWKNVNDKDLGQPLSNIGLSIDGKITVAMFYCDTNANSGRGFCNDVNEFMTMQSLASWVKQEQERLNESARSDALDLQQFLIDEGYETKLQSSTWVMRNTYGAGIAGRPSSQVTDIEGGALLLVKKEGEDHWTTAYHFPVNSDMGIGSFVDDPGNKHKHVPGRPNLCFEMSYQTLAKVKRWGLPA